MQLYADSLELKNYRNFTHKYFEFDSNISILLGPNAIGKTNTIEAIQLLTSGVSFRNPQAQNLLHDVELLSSASLSIKNELRAIEIDLFIEEDKKTFKLNGKNTNSRGIRGVLPSVLFYPDDLQIIKGQPGLRRQSLDVFGIQLHKNYSKIKLEFEKTLQQRNKILKEEYIDKNLLAAWSESFLYHAALFYLYRIKLFDKM
ncbi:MAG: AAA family ATPase, partial [Coriobacteriia bacterium]|nr:AAA family ATPase [Coriobacteriia bacterium]